MKKLQKPSNLQIFIGIAMALLVIVGCWLTFVKDYPSLRLPYLISLGLGVVLLVILLKKYKRNLLLASDQLSSPAEEHAIAEKIEKNQADYASTYTGFIIGGAILGNLILVKNVPVSYILATVMGPLCGVLMLGFGCWWLQAKLRHKA